MLSVRWALVVGLILVSTAYCEEDTSSDEETVAEEEKDVFVPSKFVTPKLSGSAHLFEFFPTRNAIGKKWIKSTAKKEDVDQEIAKYNGEWAIDESSSVSIENDFGLIVKTKARHHAIAAKLDETFVFGEKPLVVQYEVKYEEGQECGGGYLKLLSEGSEKDLASVQDKTPYTIMFGPDKCGNTGKVHLIFRYKNPKNGSIDEYHAKQPSNVGSTYWDDHKTHLYTLVVKPDGSFAVSVDQKSLFYGNMLNDLVPSLIPPKEIADPSDVKPADWDERAEIDDESAVKPDDWDESQPKEIVDESAVKPSDWLEEEPELIPDPEAKKPEDWDADMDGDWEPPSIDNPACKGVSGCGAWKQPVIANPQYKGKWVRPRIANPAYKGVWQPRQIDNPHFFEPTAFGGLAPISTVGIELWTMSENIIFDNILVADSEDIAAEAAQQTYTIRVAEDARLAASQGQGGGIVQTIVDAANERPWLWAVYVLCVLIPVVLLGVCCFGRKSNSDPNAQRKKYDSFRDDAKIPNLVDEDGEEVAEEGEDEEEQLPSKPTTPVAEKKSTPKASPQKKSTPKASPQKAKQTPQAMKDIEDDESGSGEDEESAEDVVEPVVEAPKKPVVTKRKARRQD